MITHTEKRLLPFSALAMFRLVMDVETYPSFLPWCQASRVFHKPTGDPFPNSGAFDADLSIGYGLLNETYRSHITFETPRRIVVRVGEGPISKLYTSWLFEERDHGCDVTYHMEINMKSTLLQKALAAVFDDASAKIMSSFEKRAHALLLPS